MIRRERLSARFDGDFVVFLIGMRLNRPWKVHKWWPIASAMPRMIAELQRQPERGLLHAENWFGRSPMVLQYWRSLDHLLAYARDRETAHLPAWRAFNRAVGTNGDVGIWHETYCISPGRYEAIYINMPDFGLGRAGELVPASGVRETAAGRLSGRAE